MYCLCTFITAAFIGTHDIKLEIRATNKEATTLLYAMFVYNARREDWIEVNDESVRKFPDTTVHTYTYSYRIKKSPHAGNVWAQAVFVKKNLLFHKFPDTCGRCPSLLLSRF